MFTCDYIKTIGYDIDQPTLPLSYALLLIAAIGAVGVCGFCATLFAEHLSGERQIVAAPAKPALVVAGK